MHIDSVLGLEMLLRERSFLGPSLQLLVFMVHTPWDSIPLPMQEGCCSPPFTALLWRHIFMSQVLVLCWRKCKSFLGSKTRASPLLFIIWDRLFPSLSQDGWDFLSFVWVLDPGIQTKRKTLPTRKCHGIYVAELRSSSSAWKDNGYLSLILCLWIWPFALQWSFRWCLCTCHLARH